MHFVVGQIVFTDAFFDVDVVVVVFSLCFLFLLLKLC